MELSSGSQDETTGIGERLGTIVGPGEVVCLDGELGTGKTVFVRGLARGLGLEGPVKSPTFTIIHSYPEISLCHVDAFRIGSGDELVGAGIEEYLDGSWVVAVEWAGKVREVLPGDALTVRLSFAAGDDERRIRFEFGERWASRLGRWER